MPASARTSSASLRAASRRRPAGRGRDAPGEPSVAGSSSTRRSFFARFYCASVTRCFPGPSRSGRGDRRATTGEEALCAPWRERELELLEPRLIVTVGLVPAQRLLGIGRLTDAVGKSFLLESAVAIPLPHPSGASGWLNERTNRARLGKALTHVRRELAAL